MGKSVSRRLYQYNEDDFPILVLNSNNKFSNNKFKSKQGEAVNWQLLFVSIFMCIHAVIRLGKNKKLNS